MAAKKTAGAPAETNTAAQTTERLAEDRAKAAEQETARVAEQGRLPENSAITNPAPAIEMESPSGAFVEPEIKQGIPVDHPAVDNNPRAGTSAVQNGQDFNDPAGRTPDQQDFVGQGLDPTPYGDAFKGTTDKSAS